MKKRNLTGARSLCAVFLLLATVLFFVPVTPAQAAETDAAEGYQYAVTIEFGAMTFCYDYGKWNVNEMRYKAGEASRDPANGTDEGYPGWYGFDGIANRISVKYSNENEEDGATQNRRLSVTMDYLPLSETAAGAVDGITVEFYSDAALTILQERSFTVPHTALENTEEKTVLYVSLRGEPSADGGKYLSERFIPVGLLTIRIGEISD